MPTRERRLAELAKGQPVDEQVRPGADVGLIPLYVSSEVGLAVALLHEALRTNDKLYHDVYLFLRHLQKTPVGPLTDALAALVGRDP